MNLNFFTATFPFAKGESIVENELPIISSHFDEVNIFPHFFKNEKPTRKIEKNCHILQLLNFNTQKLSLKNKILIFKLFIIELIHCKNFIFYIKHSKKWLSFLKIASKKAQYISDNNILLPNSINYTYWMNDWALVLVFLKANKTVSNFVFRCGGFDIWDERHEGNYLPFRYLIYKYADKGFPNAKIAERYMKSKTPFGDKIQATYLGVIDNGIGKFDKENVFTIISVSNVIELKRIDLIVEILKNINKPIKWVHFGDGSDLNRIKNIAAKELNQHYITFKGHVDNSELINYYQNNSVNLFLTTSSTESLPVSIQEAISFGVPIIATDVGGISEIVNETTGVLIETNFEPEYVAGIIDDFENSIYNTLNQRKKIRAFWKENFEAKKVYTEFAKKIKAFI